MQITDKNGKVAVRLLQAEAQRLRETAYLMRRAARNLPECEDGLMKAADVAHALYELGTTEKQRKSLETQEAADVAAAPESAGRSGP